MQCLCFVGKLSSGSLSHLPVSLSCLPAYKRYIPLLLNCLSSLHHFLPPLSLGSSGLPVTAPLSYLSIYLLLITSCKTGQNYLAKHWTQETQLPYLYGFGPTQACATFIHGAAIDQMCTVIVTSNSGLSDHSHSPHFFHSDWYQLGELKKC